MRAVMLGTGWKSRLTVATVAGVAGLICSTAAMRSDVLVSQGLNTALRQSTADLSFGNPQTTHRPGTLVGDEGFWLTRASGDMAAPFAKALLVGDRITIAGEGSSDRHLEVTDLKALTPTGGTVSAGSNLAQGGLMLVTCRVVDDSAHEPQPVVRFIIEMPPAPAQSVHAPKAL